MTPLPSKPAAESARSGLLLMGLLTAFLSARSLLPCSSGACDRAEPDSATTCGVCGVPMIVTRTALAATDDAPAAPAQARPQPAPRFADFRPSLHGFKFRNGFHGSPLPGGLEAIGALVGAPSNYGLCGGMASAAADFYLARRDPPTASDVPAKGTPLYNYIWARQVDSYGDGFSTIPTYARWSGIPDDGAFGTRQLTAVTLPAIATQLTENKPVILGLVLVNTRKGEMLYDNHQVLALEALPKAAGVSKLRIYDSNHPSNDAVTIESRPAVVGSITFPGPLAIRVPLVGIKSELVAAPSPARPRGVRMPVRGIFQMPYTPATPPADQALTR